MFSEDDIKKHDIDTIKKWLRESVDRAVVPIKYITTEKPLCRGVFCQDGRPERIERISYPPKHLATLQRASRIGQPRFYCGVASPAPFYELHAKRGDLVGLSFWEVMEPLWLHNLGFDPGTLRGLGAQERSIVDRGQLINAIPDESEANNDIRATFSRIFAQNVPKEKSYLYKQSIAVNEFLDEFEIQFPSGPGLPVIKEIAGTVYPSLQMRGDADNIVLRPCVVHSSLRLKSVQYVMVEEADDTKSAYQFLTIGISKSFSDGQIINWHETLGSESDRRCSIAIENGHWVTRRGDGTIFNSV
jgi:hypothetical protein